MARGGKGYSRRRVGIRELKQRFLIVCEGTETEPRYFNGFRIPTVKVKTVGVGKGTKEVVREAIKLKKKNDKDGSEPYDQIWCVFDCDSFEDFDKATRTAEKNGLRVAYSNEAFELWFLLHFHYVHTPVSRDQYSEKLSRCLDCTYEKTLEMYDILHAYQDEAIKNAAKLLELHDHDQPPSTHNPSTTVHLLVQELNRFL